MPHFRIGTKSKSKIRRNRGQLPGLVQTLQQKVGR